MLQPSTPPSAEKLPAHILTRSVGHNRPAWFCDSKKWYEALGALKLCERACSSLEPLGRASGSQEHSESGCSQGFAVANRIPQIEWDVHARPGGLEKRFPSSGMSVYPAKFLVYRRRCRDLAAPKLSNGQPLKLPGGGLSQGKNESSENASRQRSRRGAPGWDRDAPRD
jgi:hypothetical protein